MDYGKFFIYLAIMAGVTYLIRAVPFVLFEKKIENVYIKSFLTYIPYAVLAAMTFPAIFYATGDLYSGIAATLVGMFFAYRKKSLLFVAIASCVTALLVILVMKYIFKV